MAKIIKSKFRIIEATGKEFLAIGFGGGPVMDCGIMAGGVFDGFSMINVSGGEFLCCDYCNDQINPSDTCYFVAVLNKVFDKKCFKKWHRTANPYPEDQRYETNKFNYVIGLLKKFNIKIEAE